MTGRLLLRGLLAGALAALLAFAFARVYGEPQIERAIALESKAAESPAAPAGHGNAAHDHGAQAPAAHDHGSADGAEIFSRATQAGPGLAVGLVVYGAALGGILSLVFAFAYGRIGQTSPRALALAVAAAGFLSLVLVPMMKYPANPPAVGEMGTVGLRTQWFFVMLGLSVASTVLAVWLQRLLAGRLGGWNAGTLAALAYAVAVLAIWHALPEVDEVPADFPATLLWKFRLSALGLQVVLWGAIGLVFGVLAERLLQPRPVVRAARA